MTDATETDVLIAGAGPTGLVLALVLAQAGVRFRIVDKSPGPGTTSRAVIVQARTLELYRRLGLADAVLERGHRVEALNLWFGGERRARLPIGAIGRDLTPFPYLVAFPQDQHEQLLVERLATLGVDVERSTELLGFAQDADGVTARVLGPDGGTVEVRARYLAGCDGAHSVVRKSIGAEFPGGTYRQLFYVADIEGAGPSVNGEAHLDFEGADFLLVFGYDDGRRARLIGVVSDERAAKGDALTFGDVSGTAIRRMRLRVDRVNWFSTYHVHHRVADHFASGRAFIAGDAGHIHSPAGGQGMNTGIGDAFNLGWKLAAVCRGEAGEALLETYEPERIGFARRLVHTTDQVFTAATAEGQFAEILRERVAPLLLPLAAKVPAAREFMFRTVSQTLVNYRGGGLALGQAGAVHGGDRMPWVPLDGGDNYDAATGLDWQVQVFGDAQARLSTWCASRDLALRVFPWSAAAQAAGLAQGALYLIRPDGYVALADPEAAPASVESYLQAHRLRQNA